MNPISWKENVDELPEFDMDFYNTKVYTLAEKKPFKPKKDSKKNEEIMCHYYPGFILSFKTVRDPSPKIIKGFFPSIILGIFLICTF